MRSSTSSSSAARPAPGKWGSIWLASLACCALLAGAWEVVLRTRGLDMTFVQDSAELWARERERAAVLGNEAVILVGTSQMQMGIDLQTLKGHAPGTPVQLAISASPFMPVLADLAADPRITGTVICSFTMGDFVRVTTDTRAAQWVGRYQRIRESRTQLFYQSIENRLALAVDAAFLAVETGARPQQLAFGDSTDYVRTLPDRSQRADYALVDREAAYRRRVALYLSGEEPELVTVPNLEARFAELEALVQQIKARGGDVVFVTFPTTRRIWEMDETLFPKNVYWDELVRRTSARTIHFAEHDALSRFDLPDGVHFDYRDTPAFTDALSALIF